MTSVLAVPDRVQASRQHPELLGTKRVIRGTKYGNDYKIVIVDKLTQCGYVENLKTRYISRMMYGDMALHKHAIEMHEIQMEDNLKRDPAYYDDLLNYKHISCFCPPHLACHCDAIIAHLKRRAAELEKQAGNVPEVTPSDRDFNIYKRWENKNRKVTA